MSTNISDRAKKVLPGGVNSSTHPLPYNANDALHVDCAKGASIYDTSGKMYIDYNLGSGCVILGHNHPIIYKAIVENCQKGLHFDTASLLQVKLAEILTNSIPNVEMVRMVNSGSEAVICALKLATTYTNKPKIIKFSGCTLGLIDDFIFQDKYDFLVAEYNNIDSVEELFLQYPDEIAAIIIEPVASNMGVIPPETKFLHGLRKICTDNNSLLIFDEITTGFRLSLGGAQEFFAVNADIVILGKIIGGGLPIGAYGAKKEIMQSLYPLGTLHQSGTFSGNPIVMAAGITQLNILQANNAVYSHINNAATSLQSGIKQIASLHNIELNVSRVGSLFSVNFINTPPKNYNDTLNFNDNAYSVFCKLLLNKGICFSNSQHKAMYLSAAHTPKQINITLTVIDEVLAEMKSKFASANV